MSAWPQAVWVIKQLKRQVQEDFATNSNIDVYISELDKWNTKLETQKSNLTGLEDRLDNLQSSVIEPIVTTQDSQGQPEGQSDIQSGTIWFVLEDQSDSEDQGGSDQDDTITDLSGTIWYLKGNLNLPNQNNSYSINFRSNGNSFTTIQICFYNEYDNNYYFRYFGSGIVIPYSANTWENESFRIIFISGGDDATNSTLISWLQENATLVTES